MASEKAPTPGRIIASDSAIILGSSVIVTSFPSKVNAL